MMYTDGNWTFLYKQKLLFSFKNFIYIIFLIFFVGSILAKTIQKYLKYSLQLLLYSLSNIFADNKILKPYVLKIFVCLEKFYFMTACQLT